LANIIPFKGIRPAKDKVHLVASRSLDGYKIGDLKDKLEGNPYTFLHIVHPDYNDPNKTKPGSAERLQKTKRKYLEFIHEGILEQDTQAAYYIYQQIKEGNTYTGIIGCSSIDDYLNGVIKIHEQTLTEREQKLKEYLEVCDFNAEPVLFSYPNDKVIDTITQRTIANDATFDFTTTDRVRHKLWVLNDTKQVKEIEDRFANIPAIYIADGHHRSASSSLLGKSRKEKNKKHTGNEAYNFYLGVFFPEDQLKIYDFNRVVKDLNGLSTSDFIKKLSEKFEVQEKGKEIYKASTLHNISLYVDGKWYSLTAKKNTVDNNSPVGSLDASILTEQILSPILNIHDLKTDKRIAFVSGIRGMQELQAQVDSGKMKAAFGLFPVAMAQLKLIADTNNIMPPKSTWVEPKMRSGLVIYSLAD
jgi:uncharacterized protein (DUF1015 family)